MDEEETFTAFIDLLGFSEGSRNLEQASKFKVLSLLRALVELRSEFSAVVTPNPDGSRSFAIKPAISSFSDNIVISYGLRTLEERASENSHLWFLVLPQFSDMIARIAAYALRLGFLIRGGATIGSLYHSGGVVFGEALIEAVDLERHTAIYPRVVLSSAAVQKFDAKGFLKQDDDGLHYVDYVSNMMFVSASPGDAWTENVKRWLAEVDVVIRTALAEHSRSRSLNKLAKWTWFARRLRAAITGHHPEALATLGISPDSFDWLQRPLQASLETGGTKNGTEHVALATAAHENSR